MLAYDPAIAAGESTTSGNARALGTWVSATASAVLAAAGEPETYGLSPPFPAAATVRTPTRLAWSTASARSSM